MGKVNGTSSKRRARRLRFVEQDGLCWWCAKPMIWVDVVPMPTKETKPDPATCTLEHLYPKGHPRRGAMNGGFERRWVAACFKCNQSRGADEGWVSPFTAEYV